ncbi:hypothetical protein CC80DRAFT_546660 [Byssothecium circinans]|uniref:Uncharacterized protein n=1 Tax=Byssothecium circinans TaxID=147558 RepID=A0A6A5U1A4_9PLEO|nr:hypothetical protein CC80DRAFT_546660 [Byssothecium circinans]
MRALKEREKQERERQERERKELERKEREKQACEKQDRERQERKRKELERKEREKQACEKQDREKQEREKQTGTANEGRKRVSNFCTSKSTATSTKPLPLQPRTDSGMDVERSNGDDKPLPPLSKDRKALDSEEKRESGGAEELANWLALSQLLDRL